MKGAITEQSTLLAGDTTTNRSYGPSIIGANGISNSDLETAAGVATNSIVHTGETLVNAASDVDISGMGECLLRVITCPMRVGGELGIPFSFVLTVGAMASSSALVTAGSINYAIRPDIVTLKNPDESCPSRFGAGLSATVKLGVMGVLSAATQRFLFDVLPTGMNFICAPNDGSGSSAYSSSSNAGADGANGENYCHQLCWAAVAVPLATLTVAGGILVARRSPWVRSAINWCYGKNQNDNAKSNNANRHSINDSDNTDVEKNSGSCCFGSSNK